MSTKFSDSFKLSLSGDRALAVTRLLAAPRELVWKALTDPAMIPHWWLGPKEEKLTTIVDELSPQRGGKWRFVHRDPSGNEYAFRGVYHDVVAPARTVGTFEFEGMPGHVVLETLKLEETEGGTRITVHSVCQSPEDRDGLVQSGMEHGLRDTWESLAELLESLK